MNSEGLTQILIVGITPYFLDKEFFWFEENLQQVLDARHSQNFFEDNIIFLEKSDKSPIGHFDGPATISPKASLGGDQISFSQLISKKRSPGLRFF